MKNKPRFALLTLMVLAAALSRLLPHAPNFTPVAALAVFGVAAFEDARLGYVVPLLGLFASDCVLGFYRGMGLVYIAFVLVATLGYALREHRTLLRTAGVTVAGAVVFFALSNFGVWAQSGMYVHTAAGFVACYVAAIPFFRSTLASDCLYSGLLFGGLALAEQLWPRLARASAALRAPHASLS